MIPPLPLRRPLRLVWLALLLPGCSSSDPIATATGANSLPVALSATCTNQPWCDAALSPAERTRLLLAAMTLDEKISLLAGDDPIGSVTGEPAVGTLDGIPLVGMPRVLFSDGPVGESSRDLRLQDQLQR